MKKLNILIPHYHEPDNIVKPLLDSIELQVGINKNDIKVIIVNDGDDVLLGDEMLNKYTYEIYYMVNQHSGISATRNKLLDLSDSEYIMFCDCDDMFFSSLGLYTIFEYINDKGFDVLVPYFKEEVTNMWGKKIYKNHKKDRTFVHGKVYRRKYLLDTHIRFNEKIKLHEDVHFNGLAIQCTDKVLDVENCYYLWRENMSSTMRSKNDLMVDTIDSILTCYYYLVKDFLSRGFKRNAIVNTANTMYRMYYESQTEKFKKNPERLAVLLNETKKFYSKYKNLFSIITDEEKTDLLKKIKVEYLDENIFFEKITFDEWIKRLENERFEI